MNKTIRWNLFAEGECEEDDVFTVILPGETKRVMRLLCDCEVCGQEKWINRRFTVCDECIPRCIPRED